MKLTAEKACTTCVLTIKTRRVGWPVVVDDEGDEDEIVKIAGVTVSDEVVRDECLDKNLEYHDSLKIESIQEIVYNERNIALSLNINPSFSANKDLCFAEKV